MKRLILSQQGFTLLEAIIAMAILSIGVLAAAAMQGHAIRASTTAYNRTGADSLAMAFFEALQAAPYDSIQTGKSTLFDADGVKKTMDKLIAQERLKVGQKSVPDGVGALPEYTYRPDSSPTDPLVKLIFPAVANKAEKYLVWDNSGKCYSLVYSTQEIGEQAMNIRLLMVWQTPYGNNHLVYTTTRYNNKAEK